MRCFENMTTGIKHQRKLSKYPKNTKRFIVFLCSEIFAFCMLPEIKLLWHQFLHYLSLSSIWTQNFVQRTPKILVGSLQNLSLSLSTTINIKRNKNELTGLDCYAARYRPIAHDDHMMRSATVYKTVVEVSKFWFKNQNILAFVTNLCNIKRSFSR